MSHLRELSLAEAGFAARAWALAPVIEASLAVLGLRTTLDFAERAGSGRRGPRDPGAGGPKDPGPAGHRHPGPAGHPHPGVGVDRGRWLVDAAYRMHVVRGRCLPRALVQYVLQRRAGEDVRFVVGVKKDDQLEAHAWVEAVQGHDPGRPPDGFEPILIAHSELQDHAPSARSSG